MTTTFKPLPIDRIEENRLVFTGAQLKQAVIDEKNFPSNITEVYISSFQPINLILLFLK